MEAVAVSFDVQTEGALTHLRRERDQEPDPEEEPTNAET
jgi:hypothetical protein